MTTIETAFRRVDGGGPVAVSSHAIEFEERLEDMIVAEPDLLGSDRLLVIDRQVLTSHGKRLDLLAIDDQALLCLPPDHGDAALAGRRAVTKYYTHVQPVSGLLTRAVTLRSPHR